MILSSLNFLVEPLKVIQTTVETRYDAVKLKNQFKYADMYIERRIFDFEFIEH